MVVMRLNLSVCLYNMVGGVFFHHLVDCVLGCSEVGLAIGGVHVALGGLVSDSLGVSFWFLLWGRRDHVLHGGGNVLRATHPVSRGCGIRGGGVLRKNGSRRGRGEHIGDVQD